MKKKLPKRKKKLNFWPIFLVFLVPGCFLILNFTLKIFWRQTGKRNLIFASQPFLLASFDFSGKAAKIFLIPQDVYLKTAYGYGDYRLERIFDLDELNHKKGKLLSESVQNFLDIPIDGYGKLSGFSLGQFPISNAQQARTVLETAFSRLLKGNGRTDLTKSELLRFWWITKKIRLDKVKYVNLSDQGVIEEVELADGSRVKKINQEMAEKILKDNFKEEEILAEGLTIAVLNGTPYLGLATEVAKIISNMGGQIVSIGDLPDNQPPKTQKSQIRSKKEKAKSYTVKRLGEIFNCSWTNDNLEGQRADVVVIIGDDYARKFNEKEVE